MLPDLFFVPATLARAGLRTQRGLLSVLAPLPRKEGLPGGAPGTRAGAAVETVTGHHGDWRKDLTVLKPSNNRMVRIRFGWLEQENTRDRDAPGQGQTLGA